MKKELSPLSIVLSRFKQLFFSQLRLNMLSGAISMGIGIVASAIKYPIYIHFLGYEQYGVWLILSTILTFAQMGLLGIGTAINKLVAEEYGRNNVEAIQAYFITALSMLTVISVPLLGSSIVFKRQIAALMGLQGENLVLVAGLLTYMAIFSIGVLAYQILNSVLAGIGRIDLANYSQSTLQILPLLISIPLLIADKGIVSLLLANAVAYVVVFALDFIRINRIVHIDLLSIKSFSWQSLQRMMSFCSTIFMGYMSTMIVLPITKIAITRLIGVEGVPVFELAYRIGMQTRSLFEVAFKALMPEISRLSSSWSPESNLRIESIISKAYRIIYFCAIPLYLIVLMFAEDIFRIWLSADYNSMITDVFEIMLISYFISVFGLIKYYTLMGMGFINRILIAHLLKASGTLVPIGIIYFYYPGGTICSFAWCFAIGALLSTSWLLFSPKKEFK
ncbi:MAG: MATE family efflux transporter [Desulfobacteraceae bacterium]|nr:MATE family efflux transporter [Desulfobacteraceae bacterium]